MASSVAEAPSSSSSRRKNVASPPPLVDDDEDDDEFSRLLNAHKKARDGSGGAPPRQAQVLLDASMGVALYNLIRVQQLMVMLGSHLGSDRGLWAMAILMVLALGGKPFLY